MEEMTKQEALQYGVKREAILNRLKSALIERLMLDLEVDEVADDSLLFGLGLGLDSVDALEVVIAVEEEFDVAITEKEMSVMRSINTIVDHIMDQQGEKNE